MRHTDPPTWIASPQSEDAQYRELFSARERGRGKILELYFADKADLDRPLVIFQHIQKTGGTSIRSLIYSNKDAASFEMLRVQGKRDSDVAHAYADIYEQLGGRRECLVCAAGHTANYLIPLTQSRPVLALTVVRDPIEHVPSSFYFLDRDRHTTLEDLYGMGGSGPRLKMTSSNPQTRSLLAPHYDVRSLPSLASDPSADLWHRRLFELVNSVYLVGLQERFLHTIAVFAARLGWTNLYPAFLRLNHTRPREPLPAPLVDTIRRYNWLDEELYRHTQEWFAREGPAWEDAGWF